SSSFSLRRSPSHASTSACTTPETCSRAPRSVVWSAWPGWPRSDFLGGPQQAGRNQEQARQQADPKADAAAGGGEVVRNRDHADEDEDRGQEAEPRDHHAARHAGRQLDAARAEGEEPEHRESDEEDELAEQPG